MVPRFLLDEHVNPAIQRQLRRLARDLMVLRVGEQGAPAKGASDSDLLLWAEEHRFILVSEDRSTLPGCLIAHMGSGRHSAGILWIRPDTSIGRIIDELYLIWQVCQGDEFVDRAIFTPL